ncbi:H2A histone family, member Y, isoform CRA_d [Rattus norvegicus]|uniref:H2A histone family, member Y, isoform CRA_d n=1 Tax=Rattus norvegicus TaxID=10116 RepID=A6KAP3_RAT|nr:H2A histone family, member Y, isoform CRA_d [Rattus norvegicus]
MSWPPPPTGKKEKKRKKSPRLLWGGGGSFPFQFCSSRGNKVLVSGLIVFGLLQCFLLALIAGIVLAKHCVPDRV